MTAAGRAGAAASASMAVRLMAFGIVIVIVASGLLSSDKQRIFSKNESHCGVYCTMAVNYDAYLRDRAFDKYYFQKSLGAFVVHRVSGALGIALTPRTANLGLEILSGLALLAALAMWNDLMRTLGWSARQYWLGFVALFVSQVFVKLVPYAEESPDTLAFALGVGLALALCRNQIAGIYGVMTLALFVQPQLALGMVPLILLWRSADMPSREAPWIAKALTWPRRVASLLAADARLGAAVIFGGYVLAFVLAGYVFPLIRPPYQGVDGLLASWLPFSIPLAAALMTWALWKLKVFAALLDLLVAASRMFFLQRLAIIAALWIAKTMLVAVYGHGPAMSQSGTFLGSAWIFYTFQFHAIEQPLKSWVAHIVFFGPAAVLIYATWRQFAATCRVKGYGSGCVLTLAFVAILSTDSESRHFVAFLPLLTVLALSAFGEVGRFSFWAFVVWAVAATRFWGEYAPITRQVDPWLFMWGPWWTVDFYIRGVVVAALLVAHLGVSVWLDRRALSSLPSTHPQSG